MRIGVLTLAGLLAVPAGASCLESGSGAVSVTGTLIQKPLGDPARLRWLIRLEASRCVVAAPGADAEAADVRIVELMVTRGRMESDFYLIGRRVTATGFITTRHNDHEPVTVLLDVTSLEAAR